MLFLTIYMLAMVVPGAALAQALRLDMCRAAMAIALSLSVLVLALVLARAVGLGVPGFGYLLITVYVMSAAGSAVAWWLRPPSPAPEEPGGFWEGTWIVPVLTLGAVSAYVFWAGPYTEAPSDAWHHIERIGDRLDHIIIDGSIGTAQSFDEYLEKRAGYWYSIAAYFLYVTGTGFEAGLAHLAAANTLLFSAGIYSFALYVFRGVVENRWMRHWVAAASVFFFLTQFGISVFSYVRYYIFAPTFLNYIVYLAAAACILRFIRHEHGAWRFPAAAAALTVVAVLVHTQEAVFIVLMSGAVILAAFLFAGPGGFRGRGSDYATGMDRAGRRILVLLAVGIGAYLSMHAWAYLEIARHDPLKHGVMADIRNYIPFLQNLYILRPEHQFYQVLTVWGVLVYILFLARATRFLASPYLVAGMAMPILTVFNPVFTDLFLRFSWPEVLWRMCYMIPLPFVGGYFLVRSLAGAFRAPGAHRRIGHLAVAAALVGLLLPVQTTYFVSPYSKIYTLAPVAAANDHRNWHDLLQFLDTLEPARIVTDPVTGYVIKGMTAHGYSGHKFHAVRTMRVNRDSYSAIHFGDRRGGLIVINMRDGADSDTGRYGRHWPADILKVSGHYSGAFLEFVTQRSDLFELLWEHDRIAVYRIIEADEARRGAKPDGDGGAASAPN
jgi:hypothetical protein